MKTLTIDFTIYPNASLSIKGLSFKALKGLEIERCLIRDDIQHYAIDCYYQIDGNTAKPKREYIIKVLKGIYSRVPFDKIEIKGNYPINGTDLLKLILS